MSQTSEGRWKTEGPTYVTTCVVLDKPTKARLAKLAYLKHTSVSHLLNVAAEELMSRYSQSETRKEFMI